MYRIPAVICLVLATFGLNAQSVAAGDRADKAVTLHIVADIDGSDRLQISEQETLWIHRHWAWPAHVTINDIAWQPQSSPALAEKHHRSLLKMPVDFSSARMTVHQGRDTAVLETFSDHIVIHLVDSPNGRSTYELTVMFNGAGNRSSRSTSQTKEKRDRPEGLIGLATIDDQTANVGFRYMNGMVLSPPLLEHADLPIGNHPDRIQLDFRGELRLPKELAVRVRHAGGSSTQGYATLSIDGKEIETLGDDRKKNSEQVMNLAPGTHAVAWRIEGGDIGHCLLEFADAADGSRLELYHTEAMLSELGGNKQTRIVEVESRQSGWPIPRGW